MVILVVFNSFNVVKNLKKPDPVARQMPALYTTYGFISFNENPEITENLYFRVDSAHMHADLFFDHYFNFLSVKTDINKNGLNLINLEESEALERHIPAT